MYMFVEQASHVVGFLVGVSAAVLCIVDQLVPHEDEGAGPVILRLHGFMFADVAVLVAANGMNLFQGQSDVPQDVM